MESDTGSTDISDEDLVASVAEGNQDAFRTLVERYYARLLRIAGRILNDQGRAEDVVQEAMLKIWTRADLFNADRGKFSSWISRVTVNLCLDTRRRLVIVTPIDEIPESVDPGPDPEEEACLTDRSVVIDGAMQDLPERQRAALALFYKEGYTMNEVAQIMDTNPKAVESLLSRGREGLRRQLGAASQEMLL